MKAYIWTCIFWLFAITLIISIVCEDDIKLSHFKITAINYGYATYTVDVNGTSSFTWVIPAEKK